MTQRESVNYEALDLVTSQVKTSNLKRDRLRKQIKKLHERGKLDFTQLDEEWRWRLCCARLRLGDYSNWDGWQFRSDWSKALITEKSSLPRWDGRPFGPGVARLLVLGEEGIGDEVMHASVIPEAIVRLGKAGVVYECDARLHGIIKRSYGIECLPRQPLNVVRERISHWIPQGDLTAMFRRDKSHFPGKPYLKADPVLVDKWKKVFEDLTDKKKVAISWRGKHSLTDPENLMLQDAFYVNLQYDDKVELPGVYKPPFDLKNDLDDLFAIIAVMDNVVSVSTSLVHFSEALGADLDIVLARLPEEQDIEYSTNWRYGPGDTSVWSKTAKIHRSTDEYRERVLNGYYSNSKR